MRTSGMMVLNAELKSKNSILALVPGESRCCIREKLSAHLKTLALNTKHQARNLGVILDSDLNFETHIKNIIKTSFYHLRNIAKVQPFLAQADTERLMHAFITSRPDYCNSLLSGLAKKAISQLQTIRNATARVLTKTRRRAHITPVLKSLHTHTHTHTHTSHQYTQKITTTNTHNTPHSHSYI